MGNKIKGYQGLKELSPEEISTWKQQQIDDGKLSSTSSWRKMDRLYRNQQFVKKYGEDAFYRYDKNTRDTLYKNDIIRDAFTSTYSPYSDKVDALGNPIVDKNKGMGNSDEYEKYSRMLPENMQALLESGWKTKAEFDRDFDKTYGKDGKVSWAASKLGPSIAVALWMHQRNKEADRALNDNIRERIYAKDLKDREAILSPVIDEVYSTNFNGVEDSQVKNAFMKEITPSKNNVGNGLFAAYFHDGEHIESEVKNFGIDDMRKYLARKKVLSQYMTPEEVHTALNNYAQEYINENQGTGIYTGLLLKDIFISAGSYTADKVNSVRQLYNAGLDAVAGDVQVWVDRKGNIIDPDQVVQQGTNFFTKDSETQEPIQVYKKNMSRTTLDFLGKDSEGRNRSAIFNNKFWSNAERFGTLDREEQSQYEKLGFSPYKVVNKPGSDRDLKYEVAKMTSYQIADLLTSKVPLVGEMAQAKLAAIEASNISKILLNTLGKTVNAISKFGPPTIAATGIGHAYGRGRFEEDLVSNLEKIDRATYERAVTTIQQNYENNEEFRKQVDKQIESVYRQKLSQDVQTEGIRNSVIINPEEHNAFVWNEAKQAVLSQYIENGYNTLKNTESYAQDVTEAAESAGSSALTASITTGLKYVGVNNWGYRNWLFSSSASRANKAAQTFTKDITEGTNKRLFINSPLLAKGITKGKLKEVGKITLSQWWGGGWTNYTDELQSAGSRQMNEDRLNAYLHNKYSGDADEVTYGALDAVASYLNGAMGATATENSINAFIVGALGSTVNVLPNATGAYKAIATKEGREAWRKASMPEKASMLVTNGILNEYYAKKEGARNVAATVDVVNKLIDNNEEFSVLKDAVALDLASMDMTNPEEAKIATYMKGVLAMSNLKLFGNDPELLKSSDIAKVGTKSSVITEALETIDKLSSQSYTEEEAKEFLQEYYAKNPTVAQSEENNAAALSTLTENAKALQEASNLVDETNGVLDNYEMESGTKLPLEVRSRLIQRRALSQFVDKELDEKETKITGTAYSSRTPLIDSRSYGTTQALATRRKALEQTISTIDKEIETLNEQYNKARKEYKSHIDSQEETSNQANAEVLTESYNKMQDTRLKLEQAKNTKDKINAELHTLPEEAIDGVLSKDDILRLTPRSRARMLRPSNLDNYSKEQQIVIKELISELQLKDPSLLQDIEDAALLESYKESNAEAFSTMLENPEVAAYALEASADAEARASIANINQKALENISSLVEKIESASTANSDDLKQAVYNNLKRLKPSFLDYMLEVANREDAPKFVHTYADEINRAKEWSNLVEGIQKSVKGMQMENAEKALFFSSVNNVIDRFSTKDEVIDNFQKILAAKNVAEEDKAKYAKLLKDVFNIEATREATIPQRDTNERKKKASEKEEKRKQDVAEVEEEAKSRAAQQQLEESKKEEERLKAQTEEAERQAHGITEEDGKPTGLESLSKEEIEASIAQGEDVDLMDSPTLDEQQKSEVTLTEEKEVKQEAETQVIPISKETEEQSNPTTLTVEDLIGNVFYMYDPTAIRERGQLVSRKGQKADDTMSKFFNWLKTNGVQLQEIIDIELSNIRRVQPKLQVMYVNATKPIMEADRALADIPLLVVEYTNEVRNVHDEKRGGVFESGGKRYLAVGTLGFGRGSHGDAYRTIRARHREPRINYFTENPSERFFVVPNEYTEISKMDAGWRVNQLETDSNVEIRSISQLFADPNRNPKGLTLRDLKWGVQQRDRMLTIGVSSRNIVHSPKDTSSNIGSTFLLLEAANGEYIPIYINPVFASELRDGKFKDLITSIVTDLASPNLNDRLQAKLKLLQLFNLNKERDYLNVGSEDKAIVTFKKNGTIVRSFDLNSGDFTSMDLLDSFLKELNPRVNLTKSALADASLLAMLDEAGALTLDIATLNTANASYSIYDIGEDGKPIKTEVIGTNVSSIEASSDLAKADYKAKHSVVYKGKTYRYRDGKWYTNNWREVTDDSTLSQLRYHSYLRAYNVTPDATEGDKTYYIINPETNNPQVWVRDNKTKDINVLSSEEANAFINKKNQETINKSKEANAERVAETLKEVTPEETDTWEPVQLTDAELLEQQKGNFTTPVQEISEEKKEEPKEITPPTTEDINKTGSKSLAELQSRPQDGAATTADYLYKDRRYRPRLKKILEEKGFKGKPSEVNAFLESLHMPSTNITDIEAWLDMLQNCR